MSSMSMRLMKFTFSSRRPRKIIYVYAVRSEWRQSSIISPPKNKVREYYKERVLFFRSWYKYQSLK